MIVNRTSFKLETVQDTDPDLSYLGEYANRPDGQHYIDRQARGDMGRGEFRYFNAGVGDPDYIDDDYSRAEAYNRGDWHMVGVRAVVTLAVPLGTSTIMQRIASPGLWGVESDSGQEYLDEVFQDECRTLVTILEGMGLVVVDDREGVTSDV